MYLTTPALVLRINPYHDSDAFLTILTARHGKLSVKARGLRRKNSSLTAACQLLSYSEFTLFEYKDSYSINEAHVVEMFNGLRKDIVKLSLGTYFAQVADVISQEDIPNPQLLSLLLNCLYALSDRQLPADQIKAAFELRSACLSGYEPDLSCCHCCGQVNADRFDISQGVLECSGCRDPYSTGIRMPVSQGVLDAMRYICTCDPKLLLSFTLPPEKMEQLAQITEAYFSTQLERGFSTLDFYKSLLYMPDHSD